MKLEKINKYARKKAIGIGSVILSMTLLMSACGLTSAKEEIHPEEPTSTMATVMPTATLEPTTIPTPEPMLELSHEEELELLGIKDPTSLFGFNTYFTILYEKNNAKKVAFVYSSSLDGQVTVYDCFTEYAMFAGVCPPGQYNFTKVIKECAPVNNKLLGAKILDAIPIRYMIDMLKTNGIYVKDLEGFNAFLSESIPTDDTVVLNQMVAELYLLSIPKEYRVIAAELDPNYTMEETPKVKEIG